MILLGAVKDSFSITGRGTTLVLDWASRDLKFHIGDEVELRTLEGQKIRSRIKCFSHLRPARPQTHDDYGIQLEDPEPQVPLGTVICLLPKG
jgi:hypothetical protein